MEQPVVGRFKEKESGRVGECLFLPRGFELSEARLTRLFTDQWKLAPPSILLTCDCGSAHPKAFASKRLIRLTTFNSLWQEAMQQVSRPERVRAEAMSEGEEALGLVNSVLFEKLVVIFVALLESAMLAKSWLIVDRVSSKSAAAGLILEAAFAQSSHVPIIIVVDAIERFEQYTSDTARLTLQQLEEVKRGGQPLGLDEPIDPIEIDRLTQWSSFLDPTEFHDKPLPREPEKVHVRRDGKVSNRMKWQYHYLQSIFGGGTHYIFLGGLDDTFDYARVGPLGYICANGQGMAFRRMKERLSRADNMVMIHNTGGVVQAFASLHRAMLSQVPLPTTEELLKGVELVSPEAWTKEFGTEEVGILTGLYSCNPMLLKRTITQVDVLADSSEEVLARMTDCFSARRMGGELPQYPPLRDSNPSPAGSYCHAHQPFATHSETVTSRRRQAGRGGAGRPSGATRVETAPAPLRTRPEAAPSRGPALLCHRGPRSRLHHLCGRVCKRGQRAQQHA